MKNNTFTILKKYLFICFILFMFSACNFFASPPVAEFTHKAEIELSIETGEILESHKTSLDFGEITYGSSKRISITVKNTWDRPLELFTIKLKDDNGNFKIDKTNTSTVINGFKATVIDIIFDPIKPGIVTSELSISSNSETNNVYVLPLIGCTKPAPVALLIQNNVEYTNNSTYWFDNTYINNFTEVTFEIHNKGNHNLNLRSIFIENNSNFKLDLSRTSFSIDQQSVTTFTVVFNPISLNISSTLIKIETDDPKNPEIKFYVNGSSKEEPLPQISIYNVENMENEILEKINSNNIFNCSIVKKYYNFKIENTGSKTLSLNNIFLSYQNNFKIYTMPPVKSLLPGQSTYLTISFTPVEYGDVEAQVEIISNSKNNSRFLINLRGYADIEIGPKMSVSTNNSIIANQSVVSFADTYIGNVQKINFMVANNGDEILKITSVDIATNNVFRLNSSDINGATIAPNTVKSFNIYFIPASNQDYSRSVTINSNSSNNNNLEFNLYGRGISKPKYTIYNKSASNTIIENNSCIQRGYYSSTYGVYITEITIKNSSQTDMIIENISLYDYYPDNSNYGDDPLLKLTGLSNSPDTVYLLLPGESTRFQIWTWNTRDTSYTSATKIKFQHADEFNFRFNR